MATFNVLTPQGNVVPYSDVITAASAWGVVLRGGCFCNPGELERAGEGKGGVG